VLAASVSAGAELFPGRARTSGTVRADHRLCAISLWCGWPLRLSICRSWVP